jgi:predicted metal-dependent hydrolase
MPLSSLFKRKPKPSRPMAVEEREHEVAGRTLPLRITRNPRATRLTLRIAPSGGGLRVTAPPRIAFREIDRFLERHREWLEARLEKLPEHPTVRAGVKLPLRGVPHLIVHVGGRGGVTVSQDERGPLLLVAGAEESLPRRLSDFLKREAKAEIEALVAKHVAEIDRKHTAIRFRDTTSRWGSCSSSGTLSFSWRIMMAPRPVIDYLVAHEVAHLKEMNHGPRFWALCEKLCPDTKRCRQWLKTNGTALQAIAFS